MPFFQATLLLKQAFVTISFNLKMRAYRLAKNFQKQCYISGKHKIVYYVKYHLTIIINRIFILRKLCRPTLSNR